MDQEVHRGAKVLIKQLLAQEVHKVLLAQEVFKVVKVLEVHKVHKELEAHKVIEVFKDIKVISALTALLVLPDIEARKVTLVELVVRQLALEDTLVIRALMVMLILFNLLVYMVHLRMIMA